MPSIACEIANKLGLHARAAAKLTHLASGYESEIWVYRSGRRLHSNGIQRAQQLGARPPKGLWGVLTPTAGLGSSGTIDADGPDAELALAALRSLIADKFGEG